MKAEAFVEMKLMRFVDAARVLGISLRQLRRLVDDGRLPFAKVSDRSPRILASDLDSYIESVTIRRAN